MPPGRVTPRRAQRVLRGVLLGGTTAALAVSAHGMAGGGVPDTAVTLALTALVGWAGTAIADRRHGLLTTLALLGASQYGLHVLLTDVLPPSGHDHAHGTATVNGLLMLATHVVATVVSALLLTGADTALAALGRVFTGLIRPLADAPAPTTTRPTPARVGEHAGHLLAVVLREVCARRGPPLTS
ncbi:hypothetical protein V5P93_000048 [Actinokineospora auranticolor]|uniref:hypothetical protein n=1 Tax=Actinokineospora auranticolor TaxID=155976 RepID=UPI0011B01F39|nr:hypothetical protein [Actinokineospora auranticolor]